MSNASKQRTKLYKLKEGFRLVLSLVIYFSFSFSGLFFSYKFLSLYPLSEIISPDNLTETSIHLGVYVLAVAGIFITLQLLGFIFAYTLLEWENMREIDN